MNKTEPIAIKFGRDLYNQKPIVSLTLILRTIGCYWARKDGCKMCGYLSDCPSTSVSNEDLISQFNKAMRWLPSEDAMVKIFTSGSFFDTSEIPSETREEVLARLGERKNVQKIIVESRPEFINDDVIRDSMDLCGNLEVSIGLETSNDEIRNKCINKGFRFDDFVRTTKILRDNGATVKVYLLLKPPYLSEKVAIEDVVRSSKDISPYVSTISINLCNVMSNTEVENLWRLGYYRPPWLWSAVEVLKRVKSDLKETTIISDPVAAGTRRGPHNCGTCDKSVAKSISEFSLTQDIRSLNAHCDCKVLWEKVVELEDFTFGAPLVR